MSEMKNQRNMKNLCINGKNLLWDINFHFFVKYATLIINIVLNFNENEIKTNQKVEKQTFLLVESSAHVPALCALYSSLFLGNMVFCGS